MIKKLLIANRGEIAIRIARTCREMGIRTVGVASEADVRAAHTRAVDEVYIIGPAAPSRSYLRGDRLIEVAQESGADAVHPGYGFLSENAAFARAVKAAGLIWVGPPPDVIALMGDKLEARRAAKAYEVPMIPGTEEAVKPGPELAELARAIGYPVLLKASGGGGGKGIRLVTSEERLDRELAMAQSEAGKAFGNAEVYLEKAIVDGRHIEVQVLAGQGGPYLHLIERECSLQRRHQKLVEECPSSFVTPELREALTAAAVRLTEGIGYEGAGTIEFLVDADRNFYFLEMNTRLQVEHPVTEMVLGLDLVRQQLLIASGLAPEVSQADLVMRGHAIEYRVYAEDPRAGFAPSTGAIRGLELPQGPFVRVDAALFEGDEVSLHYDPMLAKLVVWGRDRREAVDRLVRAAAEFRIAGPTTTLSLIPELAASDDFREGRFHTKWLDPFVAALPPLPDALLEEGAIALALAEHARRGEGAAARGPAAPFAAWKMSGRPGFPRRHR